MPPEESPQQPAPDFRRPSERIASDGLPPRPVQRPMPPGREAPRPFTPAAPDVQAPVPPPSPPAPEQSQPLIPTPETPQFVPPKTKKRRRFVAPLLAVLAVLLIAAGIGVWLHIQAAKNNPDTALKEALLASLDVQQLQTQTTNGTASSVTQYDFSSPTSPLISNQVTFDMNGATFQGKAYGSLQNTYFSYTKLPPSVSSQITSVVQDAWVQLRAKGVLPVGVSPALAKLSDPRYEDFGPVVFGNYSQKTREQLANFMLTHVYNYQKGHVTHTTLAGTKVFVYPIKLDVGYLKIAVQSAAFSVGIAPADVQNAVDALDNFKGADVTLYVSSAQHRIQEIMLKNNGQTTTIAYDHYNNVTLPDEPVTKLTWQEFAPLEAQIESPKKK
jgi:hypothetical protein